MRKVKPEKTRQRCSKNLLLLLVGVSSKEWAVTVSFKANNQVGRFRARTCSVKSERKFFQPYWVGYGYDPAVSVFGWQWLERLLVGGLGKPKGAKIEVAVPPNPACRSTRLRREEGVAIYGNSVMSKQSFGSAPPRA